MALTVQKSPQTGGLPYASDVGGQVAQRSDYPIGERARITLAHYSNQTNNQILDQIGYAMPFLKHMMMTSTTFPSGRHIETHHRSKHDKTPFTIVQDDQSFLSAFNRRESTSPQTWAWMTLINGIIMSQRDVDEQGGMFDWEKGRATAGNSQAIIVNYVVERMSEMMVTFYEKLERYIITENTFPINDSLTEKVTAPNNVLIGAITGLTGLISRVPAPSASSYVGGIDYSLAANSYWRNISKTGLTNSTLAHNFHEVEREIRRYKGRPNFYCCGSTFYDNLKVWAAADIERQQETSAKMRVTMEPLIDDVRLNGHKVHWIPVFDDLDDANTSASSTVSALKKTLFAIDDRHLKLRFNANGGKPRPYNPIPEWHKAVAYLGQRASFGMTADRRNVHYRMEMA